MKKRLLMAIVMMIVPMAIAFQSVPPTEEDDPSQEFPGQKMSCNNYHDNAHKCKCSLASDCDAHRQKNPDLNGDGDAEMGTRCRTYCKRDHCHCLSPCTS